jgi:hypothetical protein
VRIDHSPLYNEFISFWFETFVDGNLRFETGVGFLKSEWHTSLPETAEEVLLKGQFDRALQDDAAVDSVKLAVEAAIRDGRL